MHFRQGRHHQNTKQIIIKVADTPEEAEKVLKRLEEVKKRGRHKNK